MTVCLVVMIILLVLYCQRSKNKQDVVYRELSEKLNAQYILNNKLKDKLKDKEKLDQELVYQNNALKDNNQILKANYEDWTNKIKTIEDSVLKKTQDYERYVANIEKDKEEIKNSYTKSIEEYQTEYHQVLSSAAEDLKNTLFSLQTQLLDAKQKQDSLVAIAKKKMTEENQRKYHMVQITEDELKEIQSLRQAGKILKNPVPLNKVIWKTYYEKPTALLIGRIFGQSSIISGIYKITNIENDMCYIGQSVNIAERFKQHIKRGLGAEVATKTKLYTALEEFGVENFTFEVIDECQPSQLNEREKYWIDFYHGVDFGYNSTAGNN